MAGDWIVWSKGLTHKREVRGVATRLERCRQEVAGRLMEIWEWVDNEASSDDIDSNGNITVRLGPKPLSHIDDIAGLPGFGDALVSVGWLRIRGQSGDTLEFPNLGRYVTSSAKERVKSAERQKRFRENGGGNPERWAATRVRILDRDQKTCAYCGRSANTVDHVIPRARGGAETDDNLAACCKRCNQKKTDRTPREAELTFWRAFDASVLSNASRNSECNTPRNTSPVLYCPSDSPPSSESSEGSPRETAAAAATKPPVPTIPLGPIRYASFLHATPIFALYPIHRQVQKPAALRAILSALNDLDARGVPDPAAWLSGRVVAFAASSAGKGEYVPYPAKWFEDARYDDPPEAWQEQSKNGKPALDAKSIVEKASAINKRR